MGDKSGIEWTDATWNPIVGCSVVSPGCTNCYAMKMAARIERMAVSNGSHYAGTTQASKAGPVWTGKVAFAPEHILTAPLRWKKPRMIFVNSMGDLFHEHVPDEWIDRVFAIMALSPQHTFQVLTKRGKRMREYMTADIQPLRVIDCIEGIQGYGGAAARWLSGGRHVSPNVWLGVSAEDQTRADERIPDLLATPAAVRFVSAEPLLGPIDLTLDGLSCWPCEHCRDGGLIEWDTGANACRRCDGSGQGDEIGLDWVIVGGESGAGARPMHPDWARSMRDQCAAAGVPFFFKQWGDHLPAGQMQASGKLWSPGCKSNLRAVKSMTGRYLDGAKHNAMPEAAA